MKKTLAMAVAALLLTGAAYAQQYGKQFKTDNAIEVNELVKKMKSKDKINDVVVTGTITEVCQAAGCWVKLENEGGEDIFVKFHEPEKGNHEMVVPKDISGKTITVYGVASKKTVSVKEQQHFAEDAGDDKEDIAKISKPKQTLRIDATGAVVN
jgi:hypothetical protein